MSWSVLLAVSATVACVMGHGRVLDPPSRASAWRSGFATPHNYDDDGLNCGGFSNQWAEQGGKCGICGDPYQASPPRAHEYGGTYGQGVIVAEYPAGSVFTATVELTAYHRGFWEFKLCPTPEINDQECFDRNIVPLANGDTKFYPDNGSATYQVTYRLPEGFVCDHCVLQWRYTAGNNWGDCNNGTQGLGCGNQETFGACSDVTITGTQEQPGVVIPEAIPLPIFSYLDVQQGILYLMRKGFVRPGHQHHYAETKRTRPRPTHRTETKARPSQKPSRHKINYEKKRRHRNKKKRRKKIPYWR